MRSEKIELLAPAGSREVLEAVIEAGADAVYLSGKKFAMRQHGAWLNFDETALESAIAYGKEKGVKIYVTLNNLFTDQEIDIVKDELLFLERIQPAALIVQDLGLIKLIQEMRLSIPVHSSTMANVHHFEGALLLKSYGVSRIITSRDVTLDEVKEIGEKADIEIEYFVHGDMCVAQGSQCLHSGIATEMSANRGKCLKSCRWEWELTDREKVLNKNKDEGKYLLARKDMALYSELPALISSGLHSLKIEGRARPAEYLVPIISAYREAIDRYYESIQAYQTDFNKQKALLGGTMRPTHSNNAFGRPGKNSVARTGETEPRFFSIAVEERPCLESEAEKLKTLGKNKLTINTKPELSVRCRNLKSAYACLETDCDWIYVGGEKFREKNTEAESTSDLKAFLQLAQEKGKKVALQTARMTGTRELFELEHLVQELKDCPPDEYIFHNISALNVLKKSTNVPLHADYSLNTWNRKNTEFLKENGVSLITPGLELNLEQLQGLSETASLPLECLVHGALPGMLMNYCVIAGQMTNLKEGEACSGACTWTSYSLKDKLGGEHWIEADQYCRNHIFMAKDLCAYEFLEAFVSPGISRLRIEGILYLEEHLTSLVNVYCKRINSLWGKAIKLECPGDLFTQAPRPHTSGAYANQTVAISSPLEALPTDLFIQYET